MGPYDGNIESEVENEKTGPRAKHLDEGPRLMYQVQMESKWQNKEN